MPNGVNLVAFLVAAAIAFVRSKKGNFKLAVIGFLLILVTLVHFKGGLAAEARQFYLEIIEMVTGRIGG